MESADSRLSFDERAARLETSPLRAVAQFVPVVLPSLAVATKLVRGILAADPRSGLHKRAVDQGARERDV